MGMKPRGNELLTLLSLQRFFLRLYYPLPIIVVPIAAYLTSNWWFLFGILIYYLGIFVPRFLILPLIAAIIFISIVSHYTNLVIFFLAALIVGAILWQIPQRYAQRLENIKNEISQDVEDNLGEHI